MRIVLDMTLLMVLSGLRSLVFDRTRMPPILCHLAAGMILGPTMLPQLWVEQSASKLRRVGSRLVLIVTLETTPVVIVGHPRGKAVLLGSSASISIDAMISGASTAVAAILARNALKSSYVRFLGMVTGAADPETPEEKV